MTAIAFLGVCFYSVLNQEIYFFFLKKLCPNEDIHNTRVSGFKYEEKQSWKPAQRAAKMQRQCSVVEYENSRRSTISWKHCVDSELFAEHSFIWKIAMKSDFLPAGVVLSFLIKT